MIGPAENPILKKFAPDFAPENQPKFDCEICSDTLRVSVKTQYRGNIISETKKCECVFTTLRKKKLAMMPPEFSKVSLETLKADAEIHVEQPKFVELLKKYPTGKFVISGDFGTGKTHFFWCLYEKAVSLDRRVWAGTARALIAEFQKAIEYSQVGERYYPPITAEDLRQ